MSNQNNELRRKSLSPRLLRLAGVSYLAIIVFGISSELIRQSVVLPDDPSGTLERLLSNLVGMKVALGFDMVMLACDIFLAAVLYFCLQSVHKLVALLATVFRLIQASIIGTSLLFFMSSLFLISSKGLISDTQTHLLAERVYMVMSFHSYGYDLGLFFFAFANFFLGHLIVKSGAFPKIIGFGLQLAGGVYLLGSMTHFFFPEHQSQLAAFYGIPVLAELSFAICLVSGKAATKLFPNQARRDFSGLDT